MHFLQNGQDMAVQLLSQGKAVQGIFSTEKYSVRRHQKQKPEAHCLQTAEPADKQKIFAPHFANFLAERFFCLFFAQQADFSDFPKNLHFSAQLQKEMDVFFPKVAGCQKFFLLLKELFAHFPIFQGQFFLKLLYFLILTVSQFLQAQVFLYFPA